MAADRKFDLDDFRELKIDCTNRITALEGKLSGSNFQTKSIDGLLGEGIGNLERIDALYEDGTVLEKRQIISSIYPGKMEFDGKGYRTFRTNEVVRVICMLDKGFSEIKNRKSNVKTHSSGKVVPARIELTSKV